jgi:Ribbon-helix-helix protein, copG family
MSGGQVYQTGVADEDDASPPPGGVYTTLIVMYAPSVRRTQIYLEEEQSRRLYEIAAAQGKSTAAVVRDAVDRYLSDVEASPEDSPLWEFVGSVKTLPPDAAENHDRDLYGEED